MAAEVTPARATTDLAPSTVTPTAATKASSVELTSVQLSPGPGNTNTMRLGLKVPPRGTEDHAGVPAAITGGQAERGLMVCGTGVGAAIGANKMKGIRAAV